MLRSLLVAVLVLAGCSRSPAPAGSDPELGTEGAPLFSTEASPSAEAPSVVAELDAPGVPDEPSRAPSTSTAEARGPAAPPPGYIEVAVGGIAELDGTHAMMLVDEATQHAVPVFLSGTEGMSIALRLSRERYPRPLTHDLMDAALLELGAKVHSARVEKLSQNVYFGRLVLERDGRTFELDARTSDAVAMAIGSGAPIYVAKLVLQQAGVAIDRVRPTPQARPVPTGVPM